VDPPQLRLDVRVFARLKPLDVDFARSCVFRAYSRLRDSLRMSVTDECFDEEQSDDLWRDPIWQPKRSGQRSWAKVHLTSPPERTERPRFRGLPSSGGGI
jgi:hypothetical protein